MTGQLHAIGKSTEEVEIIKALLDQTLFD